jgi:GTP-binding protein
VGANLSNPGRRRGYGFAQGPRKHRARFNKAAVDYLEHRTNLCLVFALIESGLAPQPIDLEFVEWLVRHAVPFVLVFTKTDKVSAATVQTNVAAFTARISAWFEKLPAGFTCSAETGQGRHELLGVIDEQMTAINAASSRALVPAEHPGPRVPQNPKRRPDLNRPW